jgi:hypothetical protein
VERLNKKHVERLNKNRWSTSKREDSFFL